MTGVRNVVSRGLSPRTPAQWQDLAGVLDQIIGEQQEFDRWLAEHRAAGRRIRVVSVICWAGAVELLVLLALLDW